MSEHLRCYQPEVAVGYDRTVMIQFFAVIGGGVSALVVVSMNDNNLLVFGVADDGLASSADLSIASLRGRRRIVDCHIVHEPVTQSVKTT